MIGRLNLSSIVNKFTKNRSFLAKNPRPATYFLLVGGEPSSPFFSIYGFTDGVGFVSKPTVNPATPPPSSPFDGIFNPTGTVVAIGTQNSPFITAYPFSVSSSGFGTLGTKYSDPATLPGAAATSNNGVISIAFNPTNTTIACGSITNPVDECLNVYPWDDSTGFGTQYANPASLPLAGPQKIGFNPAGNVLFAGGNFTPFIDAWAWDNTTGFGTKYADPASLPTTGFAYNGRFSPGGGAIAYTTDSYSPFIEAYNWDDSTGFGTKYADPVSLPPNGVNNLAFNPAGTALALGLGNSSPYIEVYVWSDSTGFGSKYANPATLPVSGGEVAFSPSGNSLVKTGNTTPFLEGYNWDNSTGFGTKLTLDTNITTVSSSYLSFIN